jgi:hypothetical protein
VQQAAAEVPPPQRALRREALLVRVGGLVVHGRRRRVGGQRHGHGHGGRVLGLVHGDTAQGLQQVRPLLARGGLRGGRRLGAFAEIGVERCGVSATSEKEVGLAMPSCDD